MAIIYSDIDVFGRNYTNGGAIVLYGDDAIENSMLNYLGSRRGTFVREPYKAGLFDSLIYSPLRELTVEEIAEYRTSIENTFSQFITVRYLNIIPDYENEVFAIKLGWESILTGQQKDSTVYLRSLATPTEQVFSYVGIDASGDNLYFFAMTQQPSMPEVKLEFKTDINQWIYGKYMFLNFSVSDPRYADIIALIG